MRRGFLSSASSTAPDELVWVSTKAGGLAYHIGKVVKRDEAGRAVVELVAVSPAGIVTPFAGISAISSSYSLV